MRKAERTALLCLGVMFLLGGCVDQPVTRTSAPEVMRLEKELKTEHERLAETHQQIETLRAERVELMRELEQSRRDVLEATGGVPGGFRFQPTRVSFGFLSAAVDWDNKPGDDGIQALVRIEDQTGDSIKRAGTFRLFLYDLESGKERAIETWTFTPQAATEYWRNIPSGYLFKLPFTAGTPKGKEVTLSVEVELSEGGRFHASRTFRIDH